MTRLYADEDFPGPVTAALGTFGHDILTAQDDGYRMTPDPILLARAHALGRIMLTCNRRHYARLHAAGADHSGIILIKQNPHFAETAASIDGALILLTPGRWCVRINRPPTHRP